ncbi:MAG TPA: ISKra4 family transposase [Acidimicrobiales bacterium]|nr:ISKra4 family transposase [Acidimicrobiales bacterium]
MYEGLVSLLTGQEAAALTHEQLEARLSVDGRELCRQLFQDHLDLRAQREMRAPVVKDATGVAHTRVEAGHARRLATVFGVVAVTRLAYRAEKAENLHLQDAALNLPRGLHSHGLNELVAIEASRDSYEEAQGAIERSTGVKLGKRQVEELARRAATDVDAFYDNCSREPAKDADALVISVDGKGIVMRPDALRPPTKKAAATARHKLETRLTRGEKKDRKRMAELAVVYDCAPVERSPDDILARSSDDPKAPAPVAAAKWLTASVVKDAKEVIKEAFDEAERRDPKHARPVVALVDGNNHQIDRIKAEAKKRNLDVTIVVDLIHVLEYLWGAARCYFSEADPAGERFVAEKARAVLEGKAGIVAGAIARKATMLGLSAEARKKADECAIYLKRKQPYLDYPTALAHGWPIATGVIEGACAHLVRDRMDVTGARWSVEGAEAVLKLRAVRGNGDWPEYWAYHLAEERRRVHASRYAGGVIPLAA